MGKGHSWPRNLVILGGIVFGLGSLDPLEGSVLILIGCILITIGTRSGGLGKPMVLYWYWTSGLMLLGVGALWGLSAVGGVGGRTGRSMWWLLICLPYPVAWIMAFGGIIVRVTRSFKRPAPKSI